MGALQRPLGRTQLCQPDGDTQRAVLAASLELRLKAKQQAVLVAAAAKADAAALRNRECNPMLILLACCCAAFWLRW